MNGIETFLLVVLIGVVCYTLVRYFTRQKRNNPKPPIYEPTDFDIAKAKNAFLVNINKFIPHLTSLRDGTYEPKLWTEEIIDINDDNLTSLWSKVYTKKETIERLLSSWGIKSDSCMSFIADSHFCSMYENEDDRPLKNGVKYEVLSQCWLLTTSEGEKQILLKGKCNEINSVI